MNSAGPFQPQWWFSARKLIQVAIISCVLSYSCVRTSACSYVVCPGVREGWKAAKDEIIWNRDGNSADSDG